MSSNVDETLLNNFKSLGLNESKAVDYAKSSKQSKLLNERILHLNLLNKQYNEKAALLVASLLTTDKSFNELSTDNKLYIIQKISLNDLKEQNQISAAIKYLQNKDCNQIDENDFNKECGVGVVVPIELIKSIAESSIDINAKCLPNPWSTLGPFIKTLKDKPELKWANPVDLKNELDNLYTIKFGSKDDCVKRAKEVAKNTPKPSSKDNSKKPSKPIVETSGNIFEQGFLGSLHKPGGNPQIKPELRDKHLQETDGKVITRFPPEPNGFLHIGHSKAITINFGYAQNYQGLTYLRYDDTNPEAEEKVYFESILETVRWLGFEPWKITYSSDYFQQLYDLAIELIKRGKAYVDHSTPQEVFEQRGGENRGPRVPSPWRERPIEESLKEFEQMKLGNYQPGQATLRMKQNLDDGNPQMWDLVAYRVLKSPHHRTGDKWKIYPTYDFTHCLVDSFENISHSLCTTEFILSRVSYEWLCDALEVYKPRQSEYGRLNINGTVMSKRKILKLVNEGHVRGWDDPRLYTLIALRRRGVPPSAILNFVKSLGVSTAVSSIQVNRFDQSVRDQLESSAPRLMAVLNPVKVNIKNLPNDYYIEVKKPFHPKIPEFGEASIPLTNLIYIDRSDFRKEDSSDFFRLAPGKIVGLMNSPFPIKCVNYKENNGEIVEIDCEAILPIEGQKPIKPKAFIQWVAQHDKSNSPVKVDQIRIFNQLFKSDNPSAAPNLVDDINPNSEEIINGALVEVSLYTLVKNEFEKARKEADERTKHAIKFQAKTNVNEISEEEKRSPTPKLNADQLIGNECVRFQALRTGFFALDKDAIMECTTLNSEPKSHKNDKIILNRIVSIKSSAN